MDTIIFLNTLCKTSLRLALMVILTIGIGHAKTYESKAAFAKAVTPADAKLKKKQIVLTAAQKKTIKEKYNVDVNVDTILFLLVRDNNGVLISGIGFYNEVLQKFGEPHSVGVKLSKEGTVELVGVLEPIGKYSAQLSEQSFIGQFNGKKKFPITLGKEISAITGATESCDVVVKAVTNVAGLFREFVLAEEK